VLAEAVAKCVDDNEFEADNDKRTEGLVERVSAVEEVMLAVENKVRVGITLEERKADVVAEAQIVIVTSIGDELVQIVVEMLAVGARVVLEQEEACRLCVREADTDSDGVLDCEALTKGEKVALNDCWSEVADEGETKELGDRDTQYDRVGYGERDTACE
jgi:phosphopentomutase